MEQRHEASEKPHLKKVENKTLRGYLMVFRIMEVHTNFDIILVFFIYMHTRIEDWCNSFVILRKIYNDLIKIDWLVFYANFSNISAISWRK